jgi:cytochrome c1
MTLHPTLRVLMAAATVVIVAACSGDAPTPDEPAADASSGGLAAVELEQGIGPVRDLTLGPIDPGLAADGETLFTTKCSACHKIDERYVAPALGEVLSRRRPEFVMNMMLNATEMVQKHPTVRELLAEYYTPMPVQITEEDQARAILEYLRSVQTPSSAESGGA